MLRSKLQNNVNNIILQTLLCIQKWFNMFIYSTNAWFSHCIFEYIFSLFVFIFISTIFKKYIVADTSYASSRCVAYTACLMLIICMYKTLVLFLQRTANIFGKYIFILPVKSFHQICEIIYLWNNSFFEFPPFLLLCIVYCSYVIFCICRIHIVLHNCIYVLCIPCFMYCIMYWQISIKKSQPLFNSCVFNYQYCSGKHCMLSNGANSYFETCCTQTLCITWCTQRIPFSIVFGETNLVCCSCYAHHLELSRVVFAAILIQKSKNI